MRTEAQPPTLTQGSIDANELGLIDVIVALAQSWRLLMGGAFVAAAAAAAISFAIPPVYTARTLFLPPQQQQSVAASALASLGALGGLAGAAAGLKTPADQYVALLQSATVQDRLIRDFKLLEVYGNELQVDARRELASNVRIAIGKKDGLIAVEVDDRSPQRAADLANRHVDELRRLTSQLALTEAQERRQFFEQQLAQTRDRLTKAQIALQASGFNPGALRAEPRAAAEGYARLQAELTNAEVRLQALRKTLTDNSPEVQRQSSIVSALRVELSRQETSSQTGQSSDYVGKFREFKYQETLFELFSRQYELARLDEAKEGALIQVVDVAAPPERRSWPRRALVVAVTATSAFIGLALIVVGRAVWRSWAANPANGEDLQLLTSALSRSRSAAS
ncbi:lipopolysaccharide biosynthesis protein [beta proteobacterium AAP51]|nr:lipopolysaccharide biosynthesis protein [beta proteobacterium AAP51]